MTPNRGRQAAGSRTPSVSSRKEKRLEKSKVVVIPKEKALFRLDRHGFWYNEFNQRFEHRKIIDYFHSCIRKDGHGYYLEQTHPDYQEKVYFNYEDTALFVFDVIRQGDDVLLVLNTRKRTALDPRKLFIEGDGLYVSGSEKERIKFAGHVLVRIADLLEEEEEDCYIRVGGKRFRIPERTPSPPPVET